MKAKHAAVLAAYSGVSDGAAGWYLRLALRAGDEQRFHKQLGADEYSYDAEHGRWFFRESAIPTLLQLVPSFYAFLHQPPLW